MTLGLAFWILMLLWFIGRWFWSPPTIGLPMIPDLLLFILLLLLGWHDFGPPIHG